MEMQEQQQPPPGSPTPPQQQQKKAKVSLGSSSTAKSNTSTTTVKVALKSWEEDDAFQLKDFGCVIEVTPGDKAKGMYTYFQYYLYMRINTISCFSAIDLCRKPWIG